MRETIWEYLIPCPEEKEALWNSCVFVFDTNVLLNLYRYTSITRDTLLAAFDDLKERVWIPHQVAYEFGKDRCDVIYETVEKYRNIEIIEQDFIAKLMTELRLKATDKSVIQLQDSINTWTAEQRKSNLLVTQASDDKILDTVLSIFDKKVGMPFSEEEMKAISIEGKERYERQIPPGFCDAKKEKGSDENNVYGDLIVWKQILAYSTANHMDIIYVTHDQKKDWWNTAKGRIVGPRIELRKEFSEKTGQSFYMYSMESFLELYSKHKGKTADQNVIEEVIQIENRSVRRRRRKRPSEPDDYGAILHGHIGVLQNQILRRQKTIENLQIKYEGRAMPPEVLMQLQNTERKIEDLQHQLTIRQNELNVYRHEIAESSTTY